MIQWYPGHMTSARRIIAETMPSIDVVIEVLDARMPRASANPVMTELRLKKPCLKILSKSDLADPEVTKAWISELEIDPTVTSARDDDANARSRNSQTHSGHVSKSSRQLRSRARKWCAPWSWEFRTSENPRSSTRSCNAKSYRRPATSQRSPKAIQEGDAEERHAHLGSSGFCSLAEDRGRERRLATRAGRRDSGCGDRIPTRRRIWRRAFSGSSTTPQMLVARYKLRGAGFGRPSCCAIILARNAAAYAKAATVDMHKASDALIHDFRTIAGALGRITLEAPAQNTALLTSRSSKVRRGVETWSAARPSSSAPDAVANAKRVTFRAVARRASCRASRMRA